MDISPLTQQTRPDSFEPKIAHLYEDLFREDAEVDIDLEGFWREFFLLKPDRPRLQQRLERLRADDLLQLQHESQQLFVRAVQQLKAAEAPLDENALDTLTVFLGSVLAKRFTNPSSDIITVLAGLDEVDAVFFDFSNAIESTLRTGRSFEIREKAIEVALSLTSGAWQTSLVSYFTHRDLFPALMKHIQEAPTNPAVFKPFLLLGLLANYNKFEFRNPYRLRLEDFVNELAIQKVVLGFAATCALSRGRYVAIQEDVDEGWSLGTTLSYIGLGSLAPSKSSATTLSDDAAREAFADLPGPEASILLSAYDFTNANPLFSSTLLTLPSPSKGQEAPLSSFLSYTSYLLHHAHRSDRCTLYAQLALSILRIILEDTSSAKLLSTPNTPLPVRLCRQLPPLLPRTPKPRNPVESILDTCTDALTHNLRIRLSFPLYISTLIVLHRILIHLITTRTRLQYHWSLLWQTLLSLLRFLTTYASSIQSQQPSSVIHELLRPFLATLALAVTQGDTFLPTPESYDDLFYKLVESGHLLPKFQTAYLPPSSPSSTLTQAMKTLLHVSSHYSDLLEGEKEKGKLGKNMSPKEVSKVIRAGYETLELPEEGRAGLMSVEKWREGEEKSFLKRVGREAVADGRRVVLGR